MDKLYRYRLTYPNIGKIHLSSNSRDGIKKCYRDYKNISDIPEGIFKICNLDKNKEYIFQRINKKAKMLKYQTGGNDPYQLTMDDLDLNSVHVKEESVVDVVKQNNDLLLNEINKLKKRLDKIEKLLNEDDEENDNDDDDSEKKSKKSESDKKSEKKFDKMDSEDIYKLNEKKLEDIEKVYKY